MKGLCECGCGQPTVISPNTDRHHGWVKGEPRRFVAGHSGRASRRTVLVEDRGYATPCHVWPGNLNHAGYGRAIRDGRTQQLHRWAWEKAYGPVPDGYELDHLCRVRSCMRVDHLELVTHQENMRRASVAVAARLADASPLAAARLAHRISRPDLARRLNVTTSMVSLWENGHFGLPDQLDLETLTWSAPYGADAIRVRREMVLDLYQAGKPLADIAEAAGVSTGCVGNDVRWLRDQGHDLPVRNAAFARRELAENGAPAQPEGHVPTFGRRAA